MLLRSLCACVLLCGSVSADDRLVPTPDPISTPTASVASVPECETEYAAVNAAVNAYFNAAVQYIESLSDRDVAQAELDFCLLGGGACTAEADDLVVAEALVAARTVQLNDTTTGLQDAQAAYDTCSGGSGNAEILAPIHWQIMSIR